VKLKRVISASRRTDIPRYYSSWLAARLLEGRVEVPLPYSGKRLISLEPQEVHTVVLWSKDFSRVLADEGGVRRALKRYDQVFCHFTITGLGGSRLEPRVPPWEAAIEQIPRLIDLCGDPRRLVLRFDPIIHWREQGRVRSNLPFAEPILRVAARWGIKAVKTSFATLYSKVRRRGWEWYEPSREERLELARELRALADSLGLELYSCSDPLLVEAGARREGCIDGKLLTELHPRKLPAPTARDPGQRPDCGCTVSVDIGSYRMACPGGCLYCYANPVIRQVSRDRAPLHSN
jgi:hypothetical protein